MGEKIAKAIIALEKARLECEEAQAEEQRWREKVAVTKRACVDARTALDQIISEAMAQTRERLKN